MVAVTRVKFYGRLHGLVMRFIVKSAGPSAQPSGTRLLRSPFLFSGNLCNARDPFRTVLESCHFLYISGPQRESQAGGDPEGEVRPFEFDLLDRGPDQLRCKA
jgi:hypothetical protein